MGYDSTGGVIEMNEIFPRSGNGAIGAVTFPLIAMLISFWMVLPLRADTVTLTDGTRYADVKIIRDRADFIVRFKNGRVLKVREDQINKVEVLPRSWRDPESGKTPRRRQRTAGKKGGHAEPVAEQTKPRSAKSLGVSGGGIIWRSALFPGWGQMRRGDTWRGRFFASLFTGSVLYVYTTNRHYRTAVKDQERMSALSIYPPIPGIGSPIADFNLTAVMYDLYRFDNQRAAVDRNYSDFRNALLLAAGVYLAALIDAVVVPVVSPGPLATGRDRFRNGSTGTGLRSDFDKREVRYSLIYSRRL